MTQPAAEFWSLFHQEIKEEGTQRSYSRGDFLIQSGEVERYVNLITDGAVRVGYQSATEEFTIRFGYKGSVINSIASFITGQPSEYFIEALRKTEVYRLSRDQFDRFIAQDPAHEKQYRHVLELLTVQQMEREIDLLSASPLARYERVRQLSPQVFQEIPHKYIAHYLRMTPETLSRIMNS
jgi:CRP-like cAMP-binding protein